ncbi:MAG: hypothetical protein LBC06_01070 [Rickettsiales bacterium]|nr:hypothetical protein [Rickettsiales bacterium]
MIMYKNLINDINFLSKYIFKDLERTYLKYYITLNDNNTIQSIDINIYDRGWIDNFLILCDGKDVRKDIVNRKERINASIIIDKIIEKYINNKNNLDVEEDVFFHILYRYCSDECLFFEKKENNFLIINDNDKIKDGELYKYDCEGVAFLLGNFLPDGIRDIIKNVVLLSKLKEKE